MIGMSDVETGRQLLSNSVPLPLHSRIDSELVEGKRVMHRQRFSFPLVILSSTCPTPADVVGAPACGGSPLAATPSLSCCGQVRDALAERAAAAAAAASSEADNWGGGHHMAGPPLPADLPSLAAELGALTTGVASVQALQVCYRGFQHLGLSGAAPHHQRLLDHGLGLGSPAWPFDGDTPPCVSHQIQCAINTHWLLQGGLVTGSSM